MSDVGVRQQEALDRLLDLIETAESEASRGEPKAWELASGGRVNSLGRELLRNLRASAPLLLRKFSDREAR